MSETLIEPDPQDAQATVLEWDERWSFVLKKTTQAWIWIALCRKSRQVVAYAVGDRSEQTCRRLWQAIPLASSSRRLLHGFLEGLSGGHSQREQHTAVGKETGETAHVERWNHTALATVGSLCAQDALVFQIAPDAPGVSDSLSPSLQPGTGYHAQVTHYRKIQRKSLSRRAMMESKKLLMEEAILQPCASQARYPKEWTNVWSLPLLINCLLLWMRLSKRS